LASPVVIVCVMSCAQTFALLEGGQRARAHPLVLSTGSPKPRAGGQGAGTLLQVETLLCSTTQRACRSDTLLARISKQRTYFAALLSRISH
jgi:hypothetical protein